jgi:hypothetical protein
MMKEKLTVFTIMLITCLILLVTVKGVAGNPTPIQILNQLSSESRPFELSPERGRYALTASMVDEKSVFFSPETASYVVPDLGYANGHFVSLFAPGVSMLAAPLYMIGKRIDMAQYLTFLTSSLFALANVLLIILLVKKLTKNVYTGIVTGLTFLFATNAWVYATTLYQHHISTFLILVSIYLISGKIRYWTAMVIGALFALSILVDYPDAFFFIPIIIFLILRHIDIRKQGNMVRLNFNTHVIFGLLGISLLLLPSFVYNKIAYGNPFQLSGTVQNIRELGKDNNQLAVKQTTRQSRSAVGFFKMDNLPNSMDVLLTSKDRGLVWFSPVILLSLLGVGPLISRKKGLGYALLATAGTIFLLYGMWGDPWGGWAFGPRYTIPAVGILAILLGVAIARYARKTWFITLFSTLLLYSLIVNLSGALTTNQIPPSVEALSENYPTYTYFYNISLVTKGISGSFVYNNILSGLISLKSFALQLFVVISTMIFITYYFSVRKVKKL